MKISVHTLVVLAWTTSSACAFTSPRPRGSSSSALQGSASTTTALPRVTGQSQLDPTVVDRYNSIPYPSDVILAEYVWVDADGNTRSKTRTLPAAKVSQAELLMNVDFFYSFVLNLYIGC
jgi:glutamine synthetase